MTKSSTEISVLEFRQLLQSIYSSGNNVGIRTRLIGELWQKIHLKILKITEESVTFYDEKSSLTVYVSDMQTIIQFDLDRPFQQYQPHLHYTVTLS